MSSFILFEGPSRIDGNPIVVIGTGFHNRTSNRKTGDMVQTWILKSDMRPHEAVKTKQDYSVCGDCKHRGTSCYVLTHQAPTNIYKAYKAGKYTKLDEAQYKALLKGRRVRFGAYGDPAAAPLALWRNLAKHALAFTGYTHQWSHLKNQALKDFCMASVDTKDELKYAQKLGWRTFRVRSDEDELVEKEVVCPASDEGGNKIQCADCTACDGTRSNRKSSICIVVHGAKHKVQNFITGVN